MSGPKRQHYIPISYLRNFSTVKDDKEFVEVYRVDDKKIIFPFSVRNVCVSKNLYTFPNVEGDEKYALEYFYGQNVDGVYPEVYKLLTNEDIVHISEEDREKILSVSLSLYFRTAKFLDEKNNDLDKAFQDLKIEEAEENKEFLITFNNREYKFVKEEWEAARQDARNHNKYDFLISHLQDWQDFVKHKNFSQISVLKIVGQLPLITCDNPVDIYNPKEGNFDVFNPTNSIQLPLDTQHFLWISPNDVESNRRLIYRGVRDDKFVLTSNSTSQANATEWVIGAENTLQIHKDSLAKANEDTPENRQSIENSRLLTEGMVELLKIAKTTGGFGSNSSKKKLDEMKAVDIFKNDPGFQRLLKKLSSS